ncbi:MAG: ATP-dependent helicase UvrD/PcrA [Thermoleophilaceae bacterium]|jgi:DNA helicase-2/ATP-dependent DNA helicase PcrA|nr:ATP-dependent helicase UvrD/PcrA [Thermoleophilaceae bacterium]
MPDLLDGLNANQRAVVTHPGGPLLVVAGAGTGKTRTLTGRFAWLVEQGTPADCILALTFSSPAAAEMRERLETLLDAPYEELNVSTFHAFCVKLLRDEALEAGVDPFFSPVTPADRLALLLERIHDLTLRHHEIRGNPAPLLASFVSRIDRLKDELISAEELLAWAQGLPADTDAERAHAAREQEFARLYADHDRLLAERGALDFGDLIVRAFRLLHERPHVRERTARRFRHVLVDEYQDTNFAQGMLLRLLVEEHANVTVVGDDDQAIYRFRGASQKNLVEFERELPDVTRIKLERNFRSGRRILDAATAVVAPIEARLPKKLAGASGGRVRFWRCRSERAQSQAVAAEAERLIAGGVAPEEICVLVRSVKTEGSVVAAALEERAIPFRTRGAAAYFQRAEVRDVLAWLRALADPGDSGAVVRALSRPPIELRSVDVARLTQLARRRKLDMPSAVAAALEGPQLSEEGRDRARAFLRLYRSASGAFEDRRPDAFVMRLIERIGLRRQQVFATHADTVERLRNIAKLPELATAYMRREPQATAREFARYLAAVAESGLREEEAVDQASAPAVSVMTMHAAKGLEFDHVFVLGLSAGAMPGPYRAPVGDVPDELLKERLDPEPAQQTHEAEMRRLLHVAMTRARKGLVLAWAEAGPPGTTPRPSPFYEEARAALEFEEEVFEEELFGPAEGLHSTFRIMRDELLDTVARVGGRLGEMRLDTYLDVDQAVSRYLELIKVAALIERAREGQPLETALPEVNEILAQCATTEQREIFEESGLDGWLRDTGRDPAESPSRSQNGSDASLDPFIPRRGRGLMLSASDIETYRICPLKYKFARVFRIPQEPTIHQRFGIVVHQVLERFHNEPSPSLERLRELFEISWRRSGFGDSDDELQFRERAVASLERYWRLDHESEAEPVWFERSFAFKLGPHLLRGRVDRVDRHPDGSFELIDYKTGKAKTEEDLREDVQLSLYQMGARESWNLQTSAQSYFYVLTGEKVPVEHSAEELERVKATVADIAGGILKQRFEPTPSPDICRFCDYRIICPAAEK